ncbi:MAG: family 10 glycosylhydrolase [Bacteroidetes bacterium]|nr:family 10 glycosylhydrolase [Bacteroidota bacterium]
MSAPNPEGSKLIFNTPFRAGATVENHKTKTVAERFYSNRFFAVCSIFFLLTFLLFNLHTVVSAQPKNETRAVWLTTVYNIDWPSSSSLSVASQKAEMISILDSLKAANFNTIMLQVRARGDLLYPSAIEPWGKSLTGTLGQNPGYNPLQFTLDEAHKRGIEVHAWFVTYKVYDGQSIPAVTTPLHVLRSHPEWCTQFNDAGTYSWWLDPGIPEVKHYLTSIVMEMVRNYPIDGIHFDYIRYPDVNFNDSATYATYGGGMSLGNWRRSNVNQFVYEVYDSVMSVRPDVKVGSAPIGIYKNIPNASGWEGYYDIYQDSRNWLSMGKHDYVCPQIYWDIANPPSDPSFPALVTDWVNNTSNRHVYTGIAAYRMNVKSGKISGNHAEYFYDVLGNFTKNNWPSSEITNQVDTSRALGAEGQTYFSNTDIVSNLKNIFTMLKTGEYHYPANIPSMQWKDNIPPNAPQNLTITNIDSLHYLLSWNPPSLPSDNDTVKYYNIYRSDISPVDISDIKKVAKFHVMHSNSSLIALNNPQSNPVYFTLTAYDNGYNESQPANTVNTSNCATISITAGNWQTADFTASFSDTAFCSVAQKFYQALDCNNNEWRANGMQGFFNDNFETAVNPEWTNATGTWSISGGHLHQADQANSNTNIYAAVNQNGSDSYLYHWHMNISGNGTNRRAGIHFFCDDASQTNRQNSYMVYFRADNDKVQIYKYTNNTGVLETDDACNVNVNTWYDCKIIYNKTSGQINVYLNNALVSSWTDPAPLVTGIQISLRTGECDVLYDDVKVYKSRSANEIITIGDQTADVRYQNSNPANPSCRIKTIITNPDGYFSPLASKNINIDWTPPQAVLINDGSSQDVDTVYTNSILQANWTASSDTNSGILKYMYAIGSVAGDSDLVAWADNGLNTSASVNGLNLTNGQQYFYSVKAVNGAGLATISTSDGVCVAIAPLALFNASDTVICEGDVVAYNNYSMNADNFYWNFEGGSPPASAQENPAVTYDSSGVFNVELEVEGPGGSDTLVKQGYITVSPKPQAHFTVSDTVLYLPNAYATFSNLSADASSYLWNFGDGITSADENPWHLYTSPGLYTITLIAFNTHCGSDTLILQDLVHIENLNYIAGSNNMIFLNVIPNPLNEKSVLFYELYSPEEITVSICDVLGKEITLLNKTFQQKGPHTISLYPFMNRISYGIYFIKVIAGEKTSVLKIRY